MVRALVTPADVVLEVGARFGTTSCELARATGNAGRVVAVEPDASVHAALLANRDAHCCNVAVLRGTVGAHPLVMSRSGRSYNSQTRAARPGEPSLPHSTVAQLEARVGAPFTTALIDCEGCIDHVLGGDGGAPLLSRLQLLLMEEDNNQRATVNYSAWYGRLRALGFRLVWRAAESVMECAAGYRPLVHSAWQRGGDPVRAHPRTCVEFRARMGYSHAQLRCMPHSDEPPAVCQ